MFKIVLAVPSLALVLLLSSCVGGTDPATDITKSSARLNAHGYTNDGPATWWWEYDTVQSELGTSSDVEVCGSGTGPKEPDHRCGPATGGSAQAPVSLNVVIDGLQPDTRYYFRACGQDTNDTSPSCGAVKDFRTQRFAIEPIVEENLAAVAAHAARGGAAPTISGLPCDATCNALWQQEQLVVPASSPAAEELHRALRKERTIEKFLPKLAGAARVISLAGATGYVGWKIGQFANTRYLRIGLPGIGQPGPPATGHRLSFWDYGEGQVTSGGASLPNNVYVFTYDAYSQTWTHILTDSRVGPACRYTPAPTGMHTAQGTLGQCVQDAQTTSYYIDEDELPAFAAVQDYIGQPFDLETLTWQDYPTTAAEAERRVGLALERDDSTESWYSSQLDPDNEDDPTEPDEDSRPSCRRSTPSGADPLPGLGYSGRNRGWYEPAVAQFTRKEGGQTTAAFLRPGRVEAPDQDGDGQTFEGWGYRHVKAKHGWSQADATDTQAALSLDPVESTDTTRVHKFFYTLNGAPCVRIVVVQTARKRDELLGDDQGQFPPKEIITSRAMLQ